MKYNYFKFLKIFQFRNLKHELFFTKKEKNVVKKSNDLLNYEKVCELICFAFKGSFL